MTEIIYSKKGFMSLCAITALLIVTVVSEITGRNWIDATMFWATLSSIIMPYLIAQGIADMGKEQAKVVSTSTETTTIDNSRSIQ